MYYVDIGDPLCP